MGSHVWRPLLVAIGIVALILAMRLVMVPSDFGVHERGYMYGWHRKGNETEWRAVTIKYRGTAYCAGCHKDKYADIKDSPHGRIQCENCHGPALKHPDDPKSLTIDRSRTLCLRCHFKLRYAASDRGAIRGINPQTHYPQAECVLCHYPHNPIRPAPARKRS
jgi:predicted CXXCH cytochrome family protein